MIYIPKYTLSSPIKSQIIAQNNQDNPDVDTLKNTIKRLQSELEEHKSRSISQTSAENFFLTQDKNNQSEVRVSTSTSDFSIIRTENEELKRKIKNLEEQSMLNVRRAQNTLTKSETE